MAQLEGMGFPKIRCQKALLATGNADPTVAMEWLFTHMEDPGIALSERYNAFKLLINEQESTIQSLLAAAAPRILNRPLIRLLCSVIWGSLPLRLGRRYVKR